MTNPVPVKRHLVQTSTDFSTWTTQAAIRCTQASEGQGQIAGGATLLRDLGNVAQPGAAFATVAVADLLGRFVRILIEDTGGAITVDAVEYSEIWWGKVATSSLVDDGGGLGLQTLSCVGILDVLDKVSISRGAEHRVGASGPGPSNVVDPGYMPVFNRALGGSDSTDAEVVIAADGGNVSGYAHDRSQINRYEWTAGEILDHVLKLCAHGEFSPTYARQGALRWTYADPSGCLDYVPKDLDIDGLSVLAAIASLINTRRGLTFRVTVSGSTATINVTSTTPAQIAGGTYTLPAAVATHAPDLTAGAASQIAGVELIEDVSSCYDIIEIIGAQPWIGMTLSYKATPDETTALGKGWTTAQEASWDDGEQSTDLDRVWRRFALRGEWLGQQYDSASNGLAAALEYAVDGSSDGDRSFDASGYTWQPETLRCTRELPCGVGFGADLTKGHQDPLLFIVDGEDTWDLNGSDKVRPAVGITVEEIPGAVVLGHQNIDANRFKGADEDGQTILVTMGLRESQPLRVRWVRSSASWPCSVPRILTLRSPQYERWIVLPDTVMGVDPDTGGLLTLPSPIIARDDLPAMRQALATLRPWYAEPARTLNYSKRGLIDFSGTTAPGVLVTTATLGVGARTINAPYARRSWDFTADGYGTAWSTERMVPDLESIR